MKRVALLVVTLAAYAALVFLVVTLSACGSPVAPESIITEIPDGTYVGTVGTKSLYINLRKPNFLWVESPPRVEKPGTVVNTTLLFDGGGSVTLTVQDNCLTSLTVNVCS